MNQYKLELDELLNVKASDYDERESKKSDLFLKKIIASGIILYGSGGFGKRTLKGLRSLGIEPLCFADNNSQSWNTSAEGLTIYSPADAVRKYPKAVFMVTIWSDKIGHPVKEVKKILHNETRVAVSSFFPLFYKYPQVFLPYFSLDMPNKTKDQADLVYKGYSLFGDETSRKEYLAQVRMRLNSDVEGLGIEKGSRYHFDNDLFRLDSNEVIVDIGAFDGDTLKDFLALRQGQFKKYFAFEPDPVNFQKLKKFVSGIPDDVRNKVTVEQLAVSDRKKKIAFDAEGSLQSTFSEEGNIIVSCISLDDHIFNHQPTYIKMDAEGAEPEIIKGAEKIIQEYTPVLAISVYHQFDHLWTLPLEIQRLSNDYMFYLRPLCKVSWDLICYAVPKNRNIY